MAEVEDAFELSHRLVPQDEPTLPIVGPNPAHHRHLLAQGPPNRRRAAAGKSLNARHGDANGTDLADEGKSLQRPVQQGIRGRRPEARSAYHGNLSCPGIDVEIIQPPVDIGLAADVDVVTTPIHGDLG